jgi:P pilus assembly chaperone PapD
LTDISQPVEFRLEPGKTIKVKVLDMEGKPIPQARVCPFRWRQPIPSSPASHENWPTQIHHEKICYFPVPGG